MNLKRVICGVIAVSLSLIALYMTTTFYATYGRDSAEATVFVALAVCSMAIKLVAPSAAAMMRGHIAVQIALWLGFGAALCFDALGTGGYIEMTYGAKSGAVVQEASDYKDAESKRNAAKTALEEYSDAKGSATEAELALRVAKTEAGNCPKSRAHTDACKAVVAAETLIARIAERDRRASVLAKLESYLTTLNKPTAADDAQASILSKLGSRIGWEGLGDFVALIISVLIFLFFEIVAPAMSFAALHGSISKPVVKPPENRARPPDTGRPAPARRPRAAKGSGDVFAFLSELVAGKQTAPGVAVSGRKVYGAQRAIGQALGVSGAAVNRQLTALHDAGAIALDTSGGRTEIELLG